MRFMLTQIRRRLTAFRPSSAIVGAPARAAARRMVISSIERHGLVIPRKAGALIAYAIQFFSYGND